MTVPLKPGHKACVILSSLTIQCCHSWRQYRLLAMPFTERGSIRDSIPNSEIDSELSFTTSNQLVMANYDIYCTSAQDSDLAEKMQEKKTGLGIRSFQKNGTIFAFFSVFL